MGSKVRQDQCVGNNGGGKGWTLAIQGVVHPLTCPVFSPAGCPNHPPRKVEADWVAGLVADESTMKQFALDYMVPVEVRD